MVADNTTNGNGQRVTNALLLERIEVLNKKFDRSDAKMDGFEKRTRELELGRLENQTEIKNMKDSLKGNAEDIERLESKYNIWSGLNSSLNVIMAGVIGFLGVNK